MDRTQKRILKVDDEQALIDVTVEILTAEGYEVRSTIHPLEAAALVTEFQPDVALVDLVMPDIDGLALSQQLSKQFPMLKIVLTGVWIADRGIEEEIYRLLEAGIICDTFEAPFERQDLIDAAGDWVRGFYHVDSATRLRDGKQFQMEISRNNWWGKSAACVSIEFLQGSRQTKMEKRELSAAFLGELSAMLRRFAEDGRAYRRELNKFAVLLPAATKQETFAKSADLTNDLRVLLNMHKLADRFSVVLDVVDMPAVETPIVAKNFSLEDAAIAHSETNTKLIKCCSDMFYSLQLIEWLADNPANIARIQGLARDSLKYLETL